MFLRILAALAAMAVLSGPALAKDCAAPCITQAKGSFDPSLPVLPGPQVTPAAIAAALATLTD